MDGRQLLLVLAHLFRKKGEEVHLEDAVSFLSFRCRFGPPSEIRRMIEAAESTGMISQSDGKITPEFLFDRQQLPLNLARSIG